MPYAMPSLFLRFSFAPIGGEKWHTCTPATHSSLRRQNGQEVIAPAHINAESPCWHKKVADTINCTIEKHIFIIGSLAESFYEARGG